MQRDTGSCTRRFFCAHRPIYCVAILWNKVHSPGAQVSKCVHLAAKLCTPGAGCTLNFEHCNVMPTRNYIPPGSARLPVGFSRLPVGSANLFRFKNVGIPNGCSGGQPQREAPTQTGCCRIKALDNFETIIAPIWRTTVPCSGCIFHATPPGRKSFRSIF